VAEEDEDRRVVGGVSVIDEVGVGWWKMRCA